VSPRESYSFERHKISGAIEADDQFWRSLEEGEFRLPRCVSCKQWTWPAHFRCGRCGSWDFEWVVLEPEGTIFTWTRTHYAFDRVLERKSQLPYVTVVAELPKAGGARVMGVLKEDRSDLHTGMPVRGTIDPPSSASKWYPAIRWEVIR
jgi:uncharacterized OB-fold protein